MAFIRQVKTASGALAIQIAHKRYGRISKIEHIGSAHTDEELKLLISLAKQRMRGNQRSLFDDPQAEVEIGLQQSHSGLLLEVLKKQYTRLGFDDLHDEDFAYLCIARIVEPTSKLDSLRVLADLGITTSTRDRLYRCLSRVIKKEYRRNIARLCFQHASTNGISLLLYDVTTLYFESQQEDDFRKSGMSKERRLEPQIIVGLLVDQTGFPLSVTSFEGNKAETKTILPIITAFKKQHNVTDITIVADAAMMSKDNLKALTQAGYHYIVGSRLQKIPYDIAEYQKTGEKLTDNQIITTIVDDYRIIYQYREKRAALDKRNIEKQIAKAEKIINNQIQNRKAKFLTVKTKEKKLNQELIDKAYALAGIKGYVTNLNMPDKEIIHYYHQLFQVEASFRMAKSDLKARPIFHHKQEAIEAHLTIVLAALAIGRTVERLSGLSLKQFVKILRPIRNGTVIISGKAYQADAIIPPSIFPLLKKLDAGH
jgi:Transposase DDE domain